MTSTKTCKNKVENKVAIVTGGASGIGEATVIALAENGARAVVIADIQDEKGQKLAESIGTQRSTYIHCDVSDEEQVKSLVESTVKLYGQLDIMFSNAGIMSNVSQNILNLDLGLYEKVFAVNVRGMAACVKHAARAMVEAGIRGSIICSSSNIVDFGADTFIDYAMSKHGIIGLMKNASYQLGKHGIRVNCVSPGPVATEMATKTYGIGVEEAEKVFEHTYPLTGVLKSKHIADAVLFFASEDSEFVTGQNLLVDGGYRGMPASA